MSDELNPVVVSLRHQVKQLIEDRDWISAQRKLIESQDLSPNNYKLLNKLGFVYDKLNIFHASECYYKQSIKLKPNDDYLHFNLASLYMKHQKYIKSKQHFVLCLQIDDNKAVTNFHYAQLLFKMNDTSNALIHYRKAAAIKPHIANYHYFAGKTAAKLNTSDDNIIANRHFTECIQLTNKKEIKYINEYVMNWYKWISIGNIFSIEETIHYLYLYAVNSPPYDCENIQKEYIHLCVFILKNQKNKPYDYYRRFSKKYKLKLLDNTLKFDPYNHLVSYEKHKILNKVKYGKFHLELTQNVKGKPFSIRNIIMKRCQLIVNWYISHNNLGIDKSLRIPIEIGNLCLHFIIDDKYNKTLAIIDKFAADYKIHFNNMTKQENIEMIFDSIFPSKCDKILFTIKKILNYIQNVSYVINKAKQIQITQIYALGCYYFLCLLSFVNITSLYAKSIKINEFENYTLDFRKELITSSFKFMHSCVPCKPIGIAFQFVTKLVVNDYRFYTIYCTSDLSTRKIMRRFYMKIKSTDATDIDTMRCIMAPVLFSGRRTLSANVKCEFSKPLINPTLNIKLLEDLIINKLDYSSRNVKHKYSIALYWLQLELKQIKNNNWNNVIGMDKIILQMWRYITRRTSYTINVIDCNLLQSFINNKNICLKPSELSWESFFDIIGSPSIVNSFPFAQILRSYCVLQMSKDNENKDNWEYCVSLLRSAVYKVREQDHVPTPSVIMEFVQHSMEQHMYFDVTPFRCD